MKLPGNIVTSEEWIIVSEKANGTTSTFRSIFEEKPRPGLGRGSCYAILGSLPEGAVAQRLKEFLLILVEGLLGLFPAGGESLEALLRDGGSALGIGLELLGGVLQRGLRGLDLRVGLSLGGSLSGLLLLGLLDRGLGGSVKKEGRQKQSYNTRLYVICQDMVTFLQAIFSQENEGS